MLRYDAVLPGDILLARATPTEITELEPISGYLCIIEYAGKPRPITCKKYRRVGSLGYVGAVCSVANSYRDFRSDRITGVFDHETGEHLGAGEYFIRFTAETGTTRNLWGLTRSQQDHLLAGLNALAFAAHCDGHWHPLEEQTIESFVAALWIRKDWPGDPPMNAIVAHARRLAPDGGVFGAALRNFVKSSTSERLLRRYVEQVVCADGVITSEEFNWCVQLNDEIDAFALETTIDE